MHMIFTFHVIFIACLNQLSSFLSCRFFHVELFTSFILKACVHSILLRVAGRDSSQKMRTIRHPRDGGCFHSFCCGLRDRIAGRLRGSRGSVFPLESRVAGLSRGGRCFHSFPCVSRGFVAGPRDEFKIFDSVAGLVAGPRNDEWKHHFKGQSPQRFPATRDESPQHAIRNR